MHLNYSSKYDCNAGAHDSGDLLLGGATDDAYGIPFLLSLLPNVQIPAALCLHQQRSIGWLHVVSQFTVEVEWGAKHVDSRSISQAS